MMDTYAPNMLALINLIQYIFWSLLFLSLSKYGQNIVGAT